MISNSTNVSKTYNNLSPQITEHKRDTDMPMEAEVVEFSYVVTMLPDSHTNFRIQNVVHEFNRK
jgi:hypothetical protein